MADTSYWTPRLYPKQMEVFNNLHRFLLVHGPRRSSKTWGIMHKILRHCFDNNGARVAMVCPTNKNAKSGGVWVDLTTIAIPEWEAAKIGFRVTEGPKMTGDTRMSYVRIRNRHGGTSEIQLHSLDYVHDVESKFKGTKFSMFYFSELDNFDDEIVLKATMPSLRMTPEIPYEQHQWIGDTNPPIDGPNNWMYKWWFEMAKQENHPNPGYQARFHDIPFQLDDNIEMDPRDKEDLIESLKHDRNLYNRYVLGLWVEDTSDGFFREVFHPHVHIRGDITPPERKNWEVIMPSSYCHELLLGLDPGDVNHAAHIVEQIYTPSGEPIFAVLDEIVSVGAQISLRQLTEALVDRMDFWEKICEKHYGRKPRWKTWSDKSVLRYRSAADSDEALVVRNLSGGRIIPRGVDKFPGSQMTRVRILHRLLWENRIFISAHCTETIAMIKALRNMGTKVEPVGPKKHKHAFDSLTYILISEEPSSLERADPDIRAGAPSSLVIV